MCNFRNLFVSLLMATDTGNWSINLKLSCDIQAVRHVGGQLVETDRRRDGGVVAQIDLRHSNRKKSHSDVSVHTVL